MRRAVTIQFDIAYVVSLMRNRDVVNISVSLLLTHIFKMCNSLVTCFHLHKRHFADKSQTLITTISYITTT